jgi:uncharacterized protein YbjT (DUF2867 family)
MSLTSVLVLGPTGGFGQFIIAELIKRKPEFKRIAALVDNTRERTQGKVDLLARLEAQGVELVTGSPTDATLYKGIGICI